MFLSPFVGSGPQSFNSVRIYAGLAGGCVQMACAWDVSIKPGMADGLYQLTMDVDPALQKLRLGLSLRSGGTNELGHGAVARLPFGVEATDWAHVERWLGSEEANALLRRIADGHSSETLWSGDRVGRWTQDAMKALRALHAEIAARL